MRYRALGRTALQVSEVCLGTMNFGPTTSEPESFAILDRAVEHGVNFVDTANQYGGNTGVGATETIIGNWLAQGGDRREQVVLATKLYEPMSNRPNDRGLSARNIRLACDASLRRLQTDHIDLYQMHHLDRAAPWDEVWQAMETLVSQGKIIYVGSSNFAGWTVAQANEAARSRHFLGLVSEQSLYNLTERTVELEVIPACQSYGLGLFSRRRVVQWRHSTPGVSRNEASSCFAPTPTRAMGGTVHRPRRTTQRCRHRLASTPACSHGSDRRTAHNRAVRWCFARHLNRTFTQRS